MAHVNCTYHIVWRTKCSQRTINEKFERELYAYILGICREKKCRLYRINSMPDHVHMCVEIHSAIAVSEFVRLVKQESSKWMKEQRDKFPKFDGWGNGYAGFTYSVKERPSVVEYIKEQKEHHKHKTFREEYEEWLVEMGEDPKTDLFFND
ncbi:MAG: IS200/IS605 family transposase [Prevotellaceae bacterium]|nr:IS200/IS605 family transposase [Prevotellaceae bacterium]